MNTRASGEARESFRCTMIVPFKYDKSNNPWEYKNKKKLVYLVQSNRYTRGMGDNSQIHLYLQELLQEITKELKENSKQSSQEQTLFFILVFLNLSNYLYINHTRLTYLEVFLNSLRYSKGFQDIEHSIKEIFTLVSLSFP